MFSVCIPAYNEEENIARIADNIRESNLWRQSGEKELVFCVNGSTDRSASIARGLAQSDSHIKVLELKEKGKNGAWHALVAASDPRSGILFFLDADVAIEPQTLSQLKQELEKKPPLAIAGARIVPVPEKWFSIHRRAVAKIINQNMRFEGRQPFLSGQGYAIRRSEAIQVQLPADQRINDDTFLETLFDRRVKIVPSAKVWFRLASYQDYLRQRTRAKVSTELIRQKYPKLFRVLIERRRGFLPSRRKLIKGLSAGELVGFGLNQLGELIANERKRRALRKGTDTWTKVRSTKKL